MVLYVAVALLVASVLVAGRLYTGSLEGPRWTVTAFILATLAVLTAMPAGYALAMAR